MLISRHLNQTLQKLKIDLDQCGDVVWRKMHIGGVDALKK